ncbi:hypothetical protein [Thalassotalea sp. ND16A]|uniref:hypothetical protein n=1 Tax=Thalassotalea sp. ND16A TaxID=1535422 RepID=UPI00051A677D|nr:hypothetical protein [Thalassotalea sp. ND16A]KGJ98143.1 hypothetical protein ND16A_0948 [Thalassotalea sp. ND16A]
MSLEPLKSLWQGQQASMSIVELINQAKKRQRRMFLLMLFDFILWFGFVIWACVFIRANERPDSFALGVVMIISISLGTAYMLWLRTTTWGAGELDSKNLLKLSIHRCEGAMQLIYVTYIFAVVVFTIVIGLEIYYSVAAEKLNRLIIWLVAYSACIVVVGQWYRKRQLAKKQYYQQLLEQLNEPQD